MSLMGEQMGTMSMNVLETRPPILAVPYHCRKVRHRKALAHGCGVEYETVFTAAVPAQVGVRDLLGMPTLDTRRAVPLRCRYSSLVQQIWWDRLDVCPTKCRAGCARLSRRRPGS